MYRDRWLKLECDGIKTAEKVPRDPVDKEKTENTFKVTVNLFRINWKASIHQYHYDLPDTNTTLERERKLLEKGWALFKRELGTFVILWPGRVFSPTSVKDFKIVVEDGQGSVEIKVSHVREITAAEINSGSMGSASVVGQYIASQLASPLRSQRVGKRFYEDYCPHVMGHQVISGFCINWASRFLPWLGVAEPLLQVDVMYRPASSKSIVEVLKSNLEGTDIFQQVPQIKAEWLRLCVSSTVVTSYNFRVYRIKKVHFDMRPSSILKMREKGNTEKVETTFAQYLETFYGKSVTFKNQPLLEAHPEKSDEKVYLLPEFCCPTGVTAEMRKEKSTITEVLKQIKVSPQERHNAIVNQAKKMRNQKAAQDTLKAWGCELGSPREVTARQLETLQVAFSDKKIYSIEEGSFARSLRNGLQCAAEINDWLLLYPQTDEPVLDVWLRSLQDASKDARQLFLVDALVWQAAQDITYYNKTY